MIAKRLCTLRLSFMICITYSGTAFLVKGTVGHFMLCFFPYSIFGQITGAHFFTNPTSFVIKIKLDLLISKATVCFLSHVLPIT